MRGEAVGEARRHLAQLDPLLFEPGEKAPHGMGIGAAGVGSWRGGPRRNSSSAKTAFFPARCRRAGKATDQALVRGTIAFIYRTITYLIVL